MIRYPVSRWMVYYQISNDTETGYNILCKMYHHDIPQGVLCRDHCDHHCESTLCLNVSCSVFVVPWFSQIICNLKFMLKSIGSLHRSNSGQWRICKELNPSRIFPLSLWVSLYFAEDIRVVFVLWTSMSLYMCQGAMCLNHSAVNGFNDY